MIDFHGLVIVDPVDGSKPLNPDYRANLRSRVGSYRSEGKPVFLIDLFPSGHPMWVRILFRGAHRIPDRNRYLNAIFDESQEVYQEMVDFICRTVRIEDPSEVRLEFGGLEAYACVYDWATALCENVKTTYGGDPCKAPARN